jgi:hypothetical protein
MEDQYPIKEIKIMDGVYIWKPELQNVNNSQNDKNVKQTNNNNNNQNKTLIGENNYLCHNKDEMIKLYEIEFEEIGNLVQALFQSNEDMLEYDPHDYDLIQAREDNLQIIDKKIEEMIKIQEKMKGLCEHHPMVKVDIFDYFGIGKKEKDDNKSKEEDKKVENLIKVNEEEIKNKSNINSINDLEENKENNSVNKDINKEDKTQNNTNILTEIDL